VVHGRPPRLGCLGWEQRLQPLPWRVGQIASVHLRQDTDRRRLCKHALVKTSNPARSAAKDRTIVVAALTSVEVTFFESLEGLGARIKDLCVAVPRD